jgi:hypothetical protein
MKLKIFMAAINSQVSQKSACCHGLGRDHHHSSMARAPIELTEREHFNRPGRSWQRSMDLPLFVEGFLLRRRRTRQAETDPLLDHLHKVERQLQKWIGKSPKNASWFRRDPLAAMRAAGLDLEDEIMLELEQITRTIARKLK